MEEMLGNQGVTESNMMQYLGIIEQRTSEILQAYAASQQMTQAVETQVLKEAEFLLEPAKVLCSCMMTAPPIVSIVVHRLDKLLF